MRLLAFEKVALPGPESAADVKTCNHLLGLAAKLWTYVIQGILTLFGTVSVYVACTIAARLAGDPRKIRLPIFETA